MVEYLKVIVNFVINALVKPAANLMGNFVIRYISLLTTNITLQHPVARHFYWENIVGSPSHVQRVLLHIALHVSTDIGHHQMFKLLVESAVLPNLWF
jgi:hypothetical protein